MHASYPFHFEFLAISNQYHILIDGFSCAGIKKKDYYHEYLRDMYEKYGPIVREDFGSTTLIHIFDPADIAKVYWGLRVPHIAPLLETAQEYKEEKGSSQGIGNTYVEFIYFRVSCFSNWFRCINNYHLLSTS